LTDRTDRTDMDRMVMVSSTEALMASMAN